MLLGKALLIPVEKPAVVALDRWFSRLYESSRNINPESPDTIRL